MQKTPHLVVSLGVACTPGPDPPPETNPVPRQSLLRSSHFAEVNHGQTEPLFCVPQFE